MTRPSTRGGTHAFNHSTQHHTHSKQLEHKQQQQQLNSSCSSSPSASQDDDEFDSNSNNNSSVLSRGSVSDGGNLKKRVSKGTNNSNANKINNKIKNNNKGSKGEKRERRKKHLWSAAEDRLLYELVQQGGARRWDLICRHFEDRNPNQCRERWNNHVNPDVEKGPFSAAEDGRLVDLVSQHGTHWATIVDHFPRRSENALKNRYYTLISRGKASIPTTWKFCHHKLSATFFSTFHSSSSSSNPSASNSSEETGDVQASEAVAKGRTASSKADAAPKRRGRKPKRVRADDDDDDDEDYVAAAAVKRGRSGYHSRSAGGASSSKSHKTLSRDNNASDGHDDEDEPEWCGHSRYHGLEHVSRDVTRTAHTNSANSKSSSGRDSKQAIAKESPTNTPPRSTRLDRRSSSLYTIASTSVPADFNCHHHATTTTSTSTSASSSEADAAVRTAKQRADYHLNHVIECESRGKEARLGHLLHAAYVFDPVHSVVDDVLGAKRSVLGEKGGRVVDGLRAFFGEGEKGVQQLQMNQQHQQQSARKSLLHVMDPLFLCSPDADEIQHAGQDSTVETSPAGVVHKPGRGVEHGLMSSREAVMAGFLPPITAFFA